MQDTNPAFMENAKSQKLKVPTNRNRDCQESPRMGQCPSKRCHGRCHHCNTNEVLPEDAAGSRTNRSHKSSPSRGPLRSQSRSTNCGLPNSTTSSSNQRQVLWRVNECPSGQSLNTRIIKVANFKPTSKTEESNALRLDRAKESEGYVNQICRECARRRVKAFTHDEEIAILTTRTRTAQSTATHKSKDSSSQNDGVAIAKTNELALAASSANKKDKAEEKHMR